MERYFELPDDVELFGGLVALDYSTVDLERFVRVASRVWRSLPAPAWQAIADHLDGHRYVARLVISDDSLFEPGTAGSWNPELARLWFDALGVERLPRRILACLIAHELAHVHCQAIGLESTEKEADAAMENWGFDPRALDLWKETRAGQRFLRRVEARRQQRHRLLHASG